VPISSVHLAFCTSAPDPELNLILSGLHPSARKRVSRFRTSERRNQSILGRVLLAAALVELGAAFTVLSTLGVRPDGSPDVPAGLSGSISHTDGLVGAIAASGTAIGFDLEHCWNTFPEAVNYSPHNPCQGSARDPHLLRWIVSEAIAKASGVPLLDVLPLYSSDERVCLQVPWFTCTLTVGDDFLACVATSQPAPKPPLIWMARHQMLKSLAG
jgi:phosphopantetheinyl transferase